MGTAGGQLQHRRQHRRLSGCRHEVRVSYDCSSSQTHWSQVMEAVLIAASGGLDSTTLIWHAAIQPGTLVYCVHFQYGSKHNQHEEKAIAKLKERTPVNVRFHSHKVILDDIFHGGRSSLLNTGNVIPEGHYEEETMKSTVVPGRNLVLIAA